MEDTTTIVAKSPEGRNDLFVDRVDVIMAAPIGQFCIRQSSANGEIIATGEARKGFCATVGE